jgi:hypothetical protein
MLNMRHETFLGMPFSEFMLISLMLGLMIGPFQHTDFTLITVQISSVLLSVLRLASTLQFVSLERLYDLVYWHHFYYQIG